MKPPTIPMDQFITGERLEALCDIDTEKDENFEETIRGRREGVLTVFAQTHELKHVVPKLAAITDKTFIVVSQNSDGGVHYGIPKRWYDCQWKPVDNIFHWFCQNCDVDEYNVSPIPIGMENEHIFNTTTEVKFKVLVEWNAKHVDKQDKLFLCFRTGTNPTERERALSIFKGKPWTTYQEGENGRQWVASYFESMAKHKFVLCPEGNGMDTVRMWECLYMGLIPVVKPRVFVKEFASALPIFIVNKWEDVTIETLIDIHSKFVQIRWDYDILTMKHWAHVIEQKKQEAIIWHSKLK